MTTSAERRIKDLGIRLPEVRPPLASFVPYVKTGRLVFISGQVPVDAAGKLVSGQVGSEFSVEEAAEIAREVGLTLLSVIRQAAGSLDKVIRIVKINGSVNAVPGFAQQPQVIDGVSNLMIEVFGDRGRHARAAIGAGGLPGNVPVEVEAVVEVT